MTGRLRRQWLDEGAWLVHVPGWLAGTDALLREVQELGRFRQEHIVMYGRRVAQPRLTAWLGVEMDAASRYRTVRARRPFTPLVAALLGELSALRDETGAPCRSPYNSVLINWYRSGSDAISWHADDERTLGSEPVVASVSLGGSRMFALKPRGGGNGMALSVGNGDLLVMGGDLQRRWLHSVPRQPAQKQSRISLTFRRFLVDGAPAAGPEAAAT
jgi:alkylated DNA repair dioxygenase AlkB